MSDSMTQIATLLTEAAAAKNYGKKKLKELSGLSRVTIDRIFKAVPATVTSVDAIAHALGQRLVISLTPLDESPATA